MAEMQCVEVLSNRLRVRIPVQSILYVDISQSASLLHTDNGVVKTYMTFTNMRALLERSANCFLTCYKGRLVNMNRIAGVVETAAGAGGVWIDFVMDNGERVQVRKRDGKKIRQAYVLYRCAQTVSA